MIEIVRVDIGICTYRRAHVVDTIRSISRLTMKPGWRVRVIVADNDETPSAREMAEAAQAETGVAVTYIHAPSKNISIARNACLDAATAPLLAFIDDDELVSPQWLVAMLSAVEGGSAEAVLAPVRAVYSPTCPEWIRKGDFHSTKPVWVDGEIITGYTGNVMLRRTSAALEGLRFREDMGRSGGEDTAFFAAMVANGGHIGYAANAEATEAVSSDRETMGWLMKRKFRTGKTHALVLSEMQEQRWTPIGRAMLKALVCGAMATVFCLKPQMTRFWILRGTLHAGVVSQLVKAL